MKSRIENKEEFLNTIYTQIKAKKTIADNYTKTYPYFIEYFKKINQIEKENVVVGISFTYSWMPTILKKIKFDSLDSVCEILTKSKGSEVISENALVQLSETFNNSMVGTSKLLHFINPEKYAIWDSKVFSKLYKKKAYYPQLKKATNYIDYLNDLKELSEFSISEDLHEEVNKKLNYKVSKLRAIEIAIFYSK